MEKDKDFDLNLDRITFGECFSFRDSFEEYRQHAGMLLRLKKLYLSEEEVLKDHKSDNIEKVLESSLYILRTGISKEKEDGTLSKMYFDLGTDYFIQPQDVLYDVFFAYRLRQLDLLRIDTFLNYHSLNYYDNNLQEFSRFLRICIRKHQVKLLKPETIQTVNEWLETKEKQQQQDLQELTTIQKKGKLKRGAEDKFTCLSQEQTVLLIHYLVQQKVLLNDELLSNKEAGEAFEVLTGYSKNTIRLSLGKTNNYKTKENLKQIDNILTHLRIAIGKDLKEK